MPTEVVDPSPAAWATGLGRRALAGGLTGASGLIISLVAGFLMTPYILGRIGPAAYGLFILVSSLVAYGGMLDLGVGGAVVKLVAEFRARRQLEEAGVLVATVVRVYMVLALSCIGITLAAAVLVPSIFNIPPSDAGTASLIVILMGSNLALAIFSTPTVSILVGLQRYDVHNVIGTMGVLLSAIGTVIVLALGGGVVGMVALGIPMTICMRLAGAWYIRRAAPEVALRWHGASRAMTRRVASLSAAIFATQVSAPMQKQTDEIVIGAFLTISSITPYALARKLSEAAFQVTNQFVRVLLPIASGYDPVADIALLRELYVASTRATLAIFLSMAVVLIMYGDLILTVWVGSDYSGAAPVVVILVVANLALVSAYPAGAILQGMGRFRVIAVSSLVSGLFNLALSIMLVQRIGVTGVALGTLIPTAVETFLVVTPYTMRLLMVGLRTAGRRIWLPALVPVLPASVVLLLLRTTFAPTTLPSLFVASGIGSLVYLGTYFAFRASAPERTVVVEILRRVMRDANRQLPARARVPSSDADIAARRPARVPPMRLLKRLRQLYLRVVRPPSELVSAWYLDLRARWSLRHAGLALLYHRLDEQAGDRERELMPAVDVFTFRTQLAFLRKRYRIVAASDLPAAATSRRRGQRFPIAITFDDDLPSHLEHAVPALDAAGVRGTFFLCGATLDGPTAFWWDDLQALLEEDRLPQALIDQFPQVPIDAVRRAERRALRAVGQAVDAMGRFERAEFAAALRAERGPLAAGDGIGLPRAAVRTMVDRGHEIGFHTFRHDPLDTLTDDELQVALSEGRSDLEDVMSRELEVLAYPHGHADERVANTARGAGYRFAFTSRREPITGSSSPWLLGRYEVVSTPVSQLALTLARALR